MTISGSRTFFAFFLTLSAVLFVHTDTAAEQGNVLSQAKTSTYISNWQIAPDDNPAEPLRFLPDTHWQILDPANDPEKFYSGNWLIKSSVYIKDSLTRKTPFGLFPLSMVSAYEIYWDGVLIGRNGVPGKNQFEEKPGKYDYHVLIPPALLNAGEHDIIVRISHHHAYSSWKWYYGDFLISGYDAGLQRLFRSNFQPILIIGLLFIPFLFNLFLFFARKRKAGHLLFSLICLLVILDAGISVLPMLVEVPTTYIQWTVYIYEAITLLFATLFPIFFINHFLLPKKTIAIIIPANLIIFLFFTSFLTVFKVMSVTVLVISSLVTAWALYLRRKESILITVGLLISWIAYYFDFAFNGLASVMVICISISIARQFARNEKNEREAQLRSAHLENELLKKNISPHFLLNSLTSIIVWLRRDPDSAIKLIEALATEFRMITQISALKQIPVGQELELCRSHLKIMSYRKGADFKLASVDLIETDTIPPMIFHTLLENGLTHGYDTKNAGTFTITRKNTPSAIVYTVTNDGDFAPEAPPDSSGFGTKYIMSRLEESYPGRWSLDSHRIEHGWETVIEIREK